MADNVLSNTSDEQGPGFATASLTWSGDTTNIPASFLGILSGSEGSWTYTLLPGGAGNVSAGTPRVTLAADDPAVAKLGTIDTDTGNIATAAAAIQAALEGTLTVASHAVTNAGTFPVQVDGSALTALQLLDDTIIAIDASAASAKLNMVGVIRDDALSSLTPAEGDAVPLRVDANGALWVAPVAGDAEFADDAAFTVGTSSVVVIGGVATSDTVDSGDAAALALDTSRNLKVAVNSALAAGTNTIGGVTPVASAAGGMSYAMLAMAAEDNDAVIKGSAGTVYFISVQSIDATPVYLKLFDAASITPGTTSADLQFMCPAASTAANGAGIVLNFGPTGIQFATGICALISTAIGVSANTAVSANEVVVTIGYE